MSGTGPALDNNITVHHNNITSTVLTIAIVCGSGLTDRCQRQCLRHSRAHPGFRALGGLGGQNLFVVLKVHISRSLLSPPPPSPPPSPSLSPFLLSPALFPSLPLPPLPPPPPLLLTLSLFLHRSAFPLMLHLSIPPSLPLSVIFSVAPAWCVRAGQSSG